ncbi:MAG: SufE family protein [Puniceicoccaceae bacterium]
MEKRESLMEKRDSLVEELQVIEDPYERLAYIIDLGKQLPPLDEVYKTEIFRVEGCTSNLWLFPETKGSQCFFHVDSDSAVTKGIGALLSRLYSGQTPGEILAVDDKFLSEVGVPQLLSPNRRNGVASLGRKIVEYARMQDSRAKAQVRA